MSLGPIQVPVYASTTNGDGNTDLVEINDRNLFVRAGDYTRLQCTVNARVSSISQHSISQHEEYLSNLVTQIRGVIRDTRIGIQSYEVALDKIEKLLRKPWPFATPTEDADQCERELAKTPNQLAAISLQKQLFKTYACGCTDYSPGELPDSCVTHGAAWVVPRWA